MSLSSAATFVPTIEGNRDGPTLLFVQGWPDTHDIWDKTVDRLKKDYRCVRFTFPNMDGKLRDDCKWGIPLPEITRGLADLKQRVSPDKKVTLVIHDWGATWGYAFHAAHPEMVSAVVALDIGPKPGPKDFGVGGMLFVLTYQWWLMWAFILGKPIGHWMARTFANISEAPDANDVNAYHCWPYLQFWKTVFTGGEPIPRGYLPKCPTLFIYGGNKPVYFHSKKFLTYLDNLDNSEWHELPKSDHWVQLKDECVDKIATFLNKIKSSL